MERPRLRMHPEPEESVPVAPRVRWLWTLVFEAALIITMLVSDASWLVRAVVVVVGTVVIASTNVQWREYGIPRDGTP